MKLGWFAGLFLIASNFAADAVAGPVEDGKAAFEAGQYETAMVAFAEGMKSGDATSAYYLARMLELGLGVPADPVAAMGLYRKAAEAGDVAALNRVALMSYRGEVGVAQDYQKAAQFFERAAALGDANAAFNLGKMYFEGKGVAKDIGKTLEYYRQAAGKEHVLALNTLGALYREGGIGEADRATAQTYFARSASFGNAVGLFETARMILEAGTDPARMIEAHMYLNLAAARSHPNAPQALGELTALMSPADVVAAQDKARAFVAQVPMGGP